MSYSFPSELDYHMLSKMYPSTKTEYRKAPYNQSSFQAGTNSIAQVMLHKSERTFMNPQTAVLTFRINFQFDVGANASTTANSASFLINNAWNTWSRYTSQQSGGQMLDQIDRPGQLVSKILDMTLGVDDKRSMIGMGFNESNPYSNIGLVRTFAGAQNSTNNSAVFGTFTIPLIGAIGSASKLIPMFAGDIELQFTVNAVNDFIRFTAPAGVGNYRVTIDQVELVAEMLTLEESSFRELISNYPNVLNVKSQSYSYASGQSLPVVASGTTDIIMPFSLNSLKQVLWWTTPADAQLPLESVNPNLTNWNLIIGSTSYPQVPVKASSVAECYYQNQKSFGSVYSAGHNGSARRNEFARASTTQGEYQAYVTSALDYSAVVTNITAVNSSKWAQCLDLEVLNNLKESLYSGINTRGSTNTLRLNIGTALSNATHAIHIYACYDVIINFDYVNGVITYSS